MSILSDVGRVRGGGGGGGGGEGRVMVVGCERDRDFIGSPSLGQGSDVLDCMHAYVHR